LFIPIAHFPVIYQVPCHPAPISRAIDDMPLSAQTDPISMETLHMEWILLPQIRDGLRRIRLR
jgi:hypothetical protein